MKAKRLIGYLNVDLEIESSSPLDSLAEEIGRSVVVLHSGPGVRRKHLLCLESRCCPKTPEAAAHELCSAVERLSPPARALWEHAGRKEFNVGYELPAGVRAVEVALRPETVRRIVKLGATVAFTCYREDNCEPGGSSEARACVSSRSSLHRARAR